MFRVKYDDLNKVWSSNNDTLVTNNFNTSLAEVLLKSMEIHASKIAQIDVDTGEQLTFSEIRIKTIRAAQNFQRRGYNSKHVVATIADNVADLAPIVYASMCLGWPVATMFMDSSNILRMLRLTQPKIVFCEVKMYDLVLECLNETEVNAKIFTFNGTRGNAVEVNELFNETGTEDEFTPIEVDAVNETAFIMGTSGSTGPSKGVCVSHAALANEIQTTTILYANEVILCPTSLFWISGLFTNLMGTICGGTRIITTEQFSPKRQRQIIMDFKVTVVEYSSFHLLSLLKSGLLSKSDFSSVKHVFVGGSRLPSSIIEEFNSYLPNGNVNNGYGLTEIGYNIAIDYPKFTGRGGRLTNGFSVKVINENGNQCGPGVYGDILIKGTYKFLGYFQNKELTDQAIDDDGFFKTGDIGFIDEAGYLFIADRSKRIFKYFGAYVCLSEIEDVLLKSQDILSVCAVGITLDGIVQVPAVVVVRANGSTITEHYINKIVEDNFADESKLRGGVYFMESLPMSASGKPLIADIQKMATNIYKTRMDN